jgi:hypothetical protein
VKTFYTQLQSQSCRVPARLFVFWNGTMLAVAESFAQNVLMCVLFLAEGRWIIGIACPVFVTEKLRFDAHGTIE